MTETGDKGLKRREGLTRRQEDRPNLSQWRQQNPPVYYDPRLGQRGGWVVAGALPVGNIGGVIDAAAPAQAQQPRIIVPAGRLRIGPAPRFTLIREWLDSAPERWDKVPIEGQDTLIEAIQKAWKGEAGSIRVLAALLVIALRGAFHILTRRHLGDVLV
jgi:hypothetical protein